MNTTRFALAFAALLGLCPLASSAQSRPPAGVSASPSAGPSASASASPSASAPPLAVAPSAPVTGKPTPRVMSPAAQRDSAAMPDETRPEGKTVPQLSIPLGKGGPAKPTVGVTKNGKPRTGGGVNDAAARCNAEADETARAQCLDRAAANPGPATQR